MKKLSYIELGGGAEHVQASSQKHKVSTQLTSPSKGFPPRPSKQMINSSHRIPLKLSPAKHLKESRQSRTSLTGQNQSPLTNLSHSKLSNSSNIVDPRSYLAERSNRLSTSKPIIRVNQSRESSRQSRNPSVKFNQGIVLPASMPVSLPVTTNSRQNEIQRKLKILEGRVGQLHRQKQQAIAKHNEENRKVYHQNTTLKLKINQLTRVIDRKELSRVGIKPQLSKQSILLKSAQVQIDSLKNQIHELEDYITAQSSKIKELSSTNQKLDDQIRQKVGQSIQQYLVQIKNLQTHLEHKEQDINQLSRQLHQYTILLQEKQRQTLKKNELIYQLQEQLKSQAAKYSNQREQVAYSNQKKELKERLQEKQEEYVKKVKEYKQKIQEYEVAYNSNQELIKELEGQLKVYQEQQVIKEQTIQESQQQDITTSCIQLENNLNQAILLKQQSIQQLTQSNQQLMQSNQSSNLHIQQLNQQLQSLLVIDQDKSNQLENASTLLEKMTSKFQEISERYTELNQRYENQKSKMNKSEGFQGKCKKCDELLKTVLRLNNQLNPKRSM